VATRSLTQSRVDRDWIRDSFLGPVLAGSPATLPAVEITRVRRFFASRPDLRPTPLRRLPDVASEIGIGELLLKDESNRFGLPAFKAVGVTYAIHRLFEEGRLRAGGGVACATAGNHGRAVARIAREHGLHATVFVPAGIARQRIDAIVSEGANVIVHDRGYEDAVATMAGQSRRKGWTIVSDTSYPESEDDPVPTWIMSGYTRIFDEAAEQWDTPPDAMFVQAGVGGLLAAAGTWAPDQEVLVVSCEPENAACVLAAARACGLACLAAVMLDPDLAPVRAHLGLGPGSRVLVVNTEGNTDPSVYNRVVRSS
jgi:diaminopropionate ammonia-lyase